MKQVVLKWLLVFTGLFLLTSCWDQIEVNDLAIISGGGIDKTEDDLIEISVELVVAAGLGNPTAGALEISKQTLVRKGIGKTLADAIDDLGRHMPRRAFWGHTSVFIISEKIAKEGINEHIDFIVRKPELRMRGYFFVSEDPPKDYLSLLPPIEGRLAEVVREMAEFEFALPVTVKDLTQMLRGDAGAAVLPYLTKLEPETEKDPLNTIAIPNGVVIFKEGKMVKRIDQETTEGVMWFRNAISDNFLTVSLEETKGFVSIRISKSKLKLIPKIKNGVWKMTAQITGEGDIVQNTTNLNMKNPDLIKQVSAGAEKEIEQQMNKALKEVQGVNADIFGFAEEFHRKYPKQWAKEKKNWDDIFADIEVNYDINIKIARQGLSNPPAGIPEEEVKEE